MDDQTFTVYCGVVAVWLIVRLIAGRGRSALSAIEHDPVPWDAWDVGVVFALYLFLTVGCSLGLDRLRHSSLAGTDLLLAIVICCQASVHVATVFYVFQVVFRAKGSRASELGFTSDRLLSNIGRGIVSYTLCFPLLVIIVSAIDSILKMDSVRELMSHQAFRQFTETTGFRVGQQDIVTIWETTTSRPLMIAISVFAVLVAPAAEEIFFRGFLQQALRKRLGEYSTIGATAFIFAVVHMNLKFFVPLFVLGAVLSYLFSRTRSLVAPIVVHTIHNGIMIAALLGSKLSP